MGRVLSTIVAVALLLGLGVLAVMALPGAAAPMTAGSVAAAPLAVEPDAPAADTGAKYNTIALPLHSGHTSASALVNDINSTTDSTALQLLKWDPNMGYVVYDPSDPFGEDFALSVGDPLWVLIQGASTQDVYSMVGGVPLQGEVWFQLAGDSAACKYNFISVPLDKGNIITASGLATDIGNVASVLKWDATLGFVVYDPSDPFGEDFEVRIGYPYYVCMTASKTWPTP